MNNIINNKKTYDIFVFCCGKSGSTTLEYSLQNKGYSVLHVHSKKHYECVYKKNHISDYGKEHTIFDVIEESMKQKEKVYIFDSYRTPLERKISAFFHHIQSDRKLLPNYKNLTNKQIQTFFNNKHLQRIERYTSSNYLFKYFDIKGFTKYIPDSQYQICNYKNIIFIKMYFENIKIWGNLLTKIMGKEINLIRGQDTSKKEYYKRYKEFLKFYKVPKKYLLEVIQNDHEFHKFVSPQKRSEYINKWLLRTCDDKF